MSSSIQLPPEYQHPLRYTILELARMTLGSTSQEPWATEVGLSLASSEQVSWCGIWVRAMWRRAGLKIPDWTLGGGNTSYLRLLDLSNEEPQPADLVCFRRFGHQCLLEEVTETGHLKTLEGNSGYPGMVRKGFHARDTELLGIYSIEDLLH